MQNQVKAKNGTADDKMGRIRFRTNTERNGTAQKFTPLRAVLRAVLVENDTENGRLSPFLLYALLNGTEVSTVGILAKSSLNLPEDVDGAVARTPSFSCSFVVFLRLTGRRREPLEAGKWSSFSEISDVKRWKSGELAQL